MTPLDLLVGAALWLLGTAAVVSAAPPLARRLMPRGTWPTSELFLRSTLVATSVFVALPAAAGFAGVIHRPALLAGAAAVFAAGVWARRPRGAATTRRSSGPSAAGTLWGPRLPWGLAGAVVALDALLALPKPPSTWDAMTYHLYLPARWLQDGHIFHVPTVFFDNVAAYSPQNGALFHLWHMALSGGDALTTVGQAPLVLAAAVALYRLAIELGAPRHAAAWVAPPAVLLTPARNWGYTANVDVFMAAFAVAGAYWTVAYWRRAERGDLVAAALAVGLAAGAKTAGLVIAAALLTAIAAAALRRRRPAQVALAGVAALVAGGWWYVRNWALYGNPLFPLDFNLGPFHFPGAYASEALRGSFLHVDWPTWLKAVDVTVGRGGWLLALTSMAIGVAAARGRQRRWAIGVAAAAVGWAYFCFAIQPYNNQTRFLIPALWLAQLGWTFGLARCRRRALRNVLGGVLTVSGVASMTLPVRWWTQVAELRSAGVELAPLLVAALVPAALWWPLRRRRPRLARAAALATLAPLLVLGGIACEIARATYYDRADFNIYAPGYLPFTDPSLQPSRVAYAGFSMPYVLMGPGWRHRVQYLETPAEEGEGFHD
ncbi:MAG: hypothetical protein AAFY88_14545, partial [Acidobacteriota bacterium]